MEKDNNLENKKSSNTQYDAVSQTEDFDNLIKDKFQGDELYAAECAFGEDAKLVFDTVIDNIDKIAGMIMHNLTLGKPPTYYWMGLLCHYMNMACMVRENNQELDHRLIGAISDMLASGLPIVYENVEPPRKKAKIIKFPKGDIENE